MKTNNEAKTNNRKTLITGASSGIGAIYHPRNGEAADSAGEKSVVQSYMDLTGSSESQARGVFIFISSGLDEIKPRFNEPIKE